MLKPPQRKDWQCFYEQTAIEGWRVPQLERQLFQGPWKDAARVLETDGVFCGMVTAVPHELSGWIGNLIVPAGLRGRGYGSRLFAAALEGLVGRGLQSIWLTASQQGRPLYEKHGFVVVDQVERWALPAGWRVECDATDGAEKLNRLLQADRSIWGECRSVLLSHLAGNSSVFACGDSVALLQQGPDLQMIGPWYGGAASARMLLQQLVAAAKPSRELVVDLIGSSVLQPVLANFGFHCCGRNQLMARGKFHEIELQGMVSLASLGSVG